MSVTDNILLLHIFTHSLLYIPSPLPLYPFYSLPLPIFPTFRLYPTHSLLFPPYISISSQPTTLQERDRNLPCLETENEHLRVMVDELVGDRRELEEENLMLERHNRQLDEEKRRIEALLRHREQELSIQRIIEVNNEVRCCETRSGMCAPKVINYVYVCTQSD